MKADTDKCHLLVNSDESCTSNIEDFSIKNSTEEKLLGVNFILVFILKIISSLFVKKQARNYTLLHEILHYRDLNERKTNLTKAFITTQFSYCLLIWMLHCRNLNKKINWVHERALRLVYQNNLSFSELLNLGNFVTVYQKNLQVLVTEIYKVRNGIAPEIMKYIFELQNLSYNLRSACNQFRRENIKTIHYGLQSVINFEPKIEKLVPNKIKHGNSLSKFKKLIKSWKPEAFPCRLCKTYIAQVGFI